MEIIKQIAGFDLNLLRVFVAIDEFRHITKAAKTLGMTQSALSHALNRLRVLLDDSLFVKSSQGMVPTPKAKELSTPIREILEILGKNILGKAHFDSKTMERVFHIRTTDLIESLLIPRLLGVLEEDAQRTKVTSQTASFSLPRVELELGQCDLAIAGFFGDLPDGFYQQKLFTDSFICAFRKNHPRLKTKQGISFEEYCRERHVLIAPGGELTSKTDERLKRMKKDRIIVAGISSFMVSGWIVAESDSIVTGPSRLIEKIAKAFSLHTSKPPIEIPPITIVQAWHERNHNDPGHKWFREQVSSILQRN